MSPIPTQTNKDIGKKETSLRDGSTDSDSQNRIADGLVDNQDVVTTGEAQAGTSYSPLAQQPTNDQEDIIDDLDDDEEDSSDDDEVEELNEDVHFEMLASSRAFSSSSSNKPRDQDPPTIYSFETDFFERKSCLESEEIVVDDAKSKQISQLMSGFKLPESSIPDWAKHVPENVWKQNLLESIQAKKTDLFSSPNTNTE